MVGGGAAGFFCAVNAARMDPGLQVILLEKASQLLAKVRVSGGGRCNVTHACDDIAEMSRHYPRGQHFVKKAFHHFFTNDTIHWFAERGVSLKTEPDGRMFPDTDSSHTIVQCLLREASLYKVDIRMNAEVIAIHRDANGFVLTLRNGTELRAGQVCLACGGYPKTALYDWLKGTGHSVEPPVPSLFTFNIPGHPLCALMGVSVPDALVKIPECRLEQRGPVLITHWGLSGPAVLKLSAWGARELEKREWKFTVRINWVPDHNEQTAGDLLRRLRGEAGQGRTGARNPFMLPQRLWSFLLQQSGIDENTRWAELSAVLLNKLIAQLCAAVLEVSGKTRFKEEFVTAGGIRLSEIRHATMESKLVPGLYFAGEMMDVDGVTGGYNFQHAWTSGYLAAAAIAGGPGKKE